MKEKRIRNRMMIFGAFAIFFTGYPHIWSIYQPYAMELTGWSQGQASMCFYLALGTFVIGNIVGGRIQDRYHPSIAIGIGGGICSAGIFLSAFALKPSPVLMYLLYGGLQGFGQGMIYTTILSIAQKWFPKRAGFASGIIVTANGLCGFFLAPISRALLQEVGIQTTFLIVGAAAALSWILGTLYIKCPNTNNEETTSQKLYTGRQYTSSEIIRTKRFYLLVFSMFCGLLPYFIISPLSQTIQTERGIPASIAVTAVMFGSVCNASARLLLPSLADKIGRISCIKVVLVVMTVAMLLLMVAPSYIATLAIIVVYGCYGGIMGSFPSLSSSIFGLKYSGENYGYVMLGMIAATFGAPALMSLINQAGIHSNASFFFGLLAALFGCISLTLLEKEIKRN